MKSYLTVMYLDGGKYYMGQLYDDETISHFEPKKINNGYGFKENIFYLMMMGTESDGTPVIAEVENVKFNAATFEDDIDYIVLANKALNIYKRKTTFH